MNIIGVPKITLREASTGSIKGEISLRNTPSMYTKTRMSVTNDNFMNVIGGIDISSSSYKGKSAICVSPFIKAKSARFPGGLWSGGNSGAELDDIKIIERCTTQPGIDSVSASRDDQNRQTLIFKGILPNPASGRTRTIGTIYLCGQSSSALPLSSDIMFFTSLDEAFIQDSSTIVDIEYKVIFEKGTTVLGHAMSEMIASKYTKLNREESLNGLEISAIGPSSRENNTLTVTSIFGKLKNPSKYNGVQIRDFTSQASLSEMWPIIGVSDSYNFAGQYPGRGINCYRINFADQRLCGEFVKGIYASKATHSTIGRGESEVNAISEISSGSNISTVYVKNSKTSLEGRPFLDTASPAPAGNAELTVTSELPNKRLPEQFILKVKTPGPAVSAEIDVYKSYVTGYWGNSYKQMARNVPHLSSVSAWTFNTSQYKHKHGDVIHSVSDFALMHDFNVIRVAKECFLLGSVTSDDYFIFDKDDLPETPNSVWFTGYAFDINKKQVFVSCSKTGLYKVSGNVSNGDTPNIEKVSGIGKVYAINHDSVGGVTLVTDAGIKITKNFGESWTDIALSEMTNITTAGNVNAINMCTTDYSSEHLNTLVIFNKHGSSKTFWVSTELKAGQEQEQSVHNYSSGLLYSHMEESWQSDRDELIRTESNKPLGHYLLYGLPQNHLKSIGGKFIVSHLSISNSIYCYMSEYQQPFGSTNLVRMTGQPFTLSLYNGKLYGSHVGIDQYRQENSSDFYPSGSYIPGETNTRKTPCGMEWDGSGFNSMSDISMTTQFFQNGIRPFSSITDYAVLIKRSRTIDSEIVGKGSFPKTKGESVFYITGISEDKSKTNINSINLGTKTFISNGSGFDMDVDGLKISVPAGSEFGDGDYYTFIRFDGYINENSSTASIVYENSIHEKERIEGHSVAIGKSKDEMPFKYKASSAGDIEIHKKAERTNSIYSMRTSWISSPTAPFEFNSVQVGSFKIDVDLADISGAWAFKFHSLNKYQLYESRYNKKVLIWKHNSQIKCAISEHSYDESSISASSGSVLDESKPLTIEYDYDQNLLALKQESTSIANANMTTDTGTLPFVGISVESRYLGADGANGIRITTNPQSVSNGSSGGFRAIKEKGILRFPKLKESNGAVLWAPLGVKNRKEGVYDDSFVEISNADIAIKIGTNEDTVVPVKIKTQRSLSAPMSYSGGYGVDYSPIEKRMNLSSGEVLVLTDIGIVIFSDEDAGKKAYIDYSYYKDSAFGFGETVNE